MSQAQKLPDFSLMTKEEMESFIKEQMAKANATIEAQRKEHQEQLDKQLKIINNLRQENSAHLKELEITKTDNKKLTDNNNALTTIISNVLTYIRDNQSTYSKYLQDENIPRLDSYDLFSINNYFDKLMPVLLGAIPSFRFHQARSIDLGTTEQCKGYENANDTPDDEVAREDGAHDLESAAEVHVEKQDELADEELTVEKDITLNGDKNSSSSKASGPTQEELINTVQQDIKSDDPNRVLTDSTGLLKTTFAKDEGALDIDNLQNSAKPMPSRPEKEYISVNSSNKVAGVITSNNLTEMYMVCTNPECGKYARFTVSQKNTRHNTVLTPYGSFNNLRSYITAVRMATCTECYNCNVEINPAQFTNFKVTRDYSAANELSAGSKLNQSNIQNQVRAENEAPKEQSQSEHRVSTSAQECGLKQDTSYSQSKNKSEEDALKKSIRRAYHKNSDERQKERRALSNQIKHSDSAHEVTVSLDCKKIDPGFGIHDVIDPFYFDAESFGVTPAFAKSKLSVALLVAAGTMFSQLGTPKNRIFNVYEGKGFPFSREHLTGGINAFARAFLHPVATQIKNDILENCSTVIMDESTLMVRENANNNKKDKNSQTTGKKSFIWTLNTNWNSKLKAAWYCVSDTRSHKTVIDILKSAVASKVTHLLSDGYTGYDKAIDILEKEFGMYIQSARCWAHARRPLFLLLKNEGLIEIYNKYLLPKGSVFTDFEANLDKYMKEPKDRALTDRDITLLVIFYLINMLFVIDSTVVKKHGFICDTKEFANDLKSIRQKVSVKILDSIFDTIRAFIISKPDVIKISFKKSGNNKGALLFNKNNRYPESKALIYLLKYEQELKEYTKSPDIELTSNTAERSLKLGICARKSFMFLQSEDGGHAFADYQTIVNTCILNGVPVEPYMMWVVANIKLRMNEQMRYGHSDPTFFKMPRKLNKILTDENGNNYEALCGMYSSHNRYCYDRINVKGLAPYDYRKYLDSQK